MRKSSIVLALLLLWMLPYTMVRAEESSVDLEEKEAISNSMLSPINTTPIEYQPIPLMQNVPDRTEMIMSPRTVESFPDYTLPEIKTFTPKYLPEEPMEMKPYMLMMPLELQLMPQPPKEYVPMPLIQDVPDRTEMIKSPRIIESFPDYTLPEIKTFTPKYLPEELMEKKPYMLMMPLELQPMPQLPKEYVPMPLMQDVPDRTEIIKSPRIIEPFPDYTLPPIKSIDFEHLRIPEENMQEIPLLPEEYAPNKMNDNAHKGART